MGWWRGWCPTCAAFMGCDKPFEMFYNSLALPKITLLSAHFGPSILLWPLTNRGN